MFKSYSNQERRMLVDEANLGDEDDIEWEWESASEYSVDSKSGSFEGTRDEIAAKKYQEEYTSVVSAHSAQEATQNMNVNNNAGYCEEPCLDSGGGFLLNGDGSDGVYAPSSVHSSQNSASEDSAENGGGFLLDGDSIDRFIMI